MIKIIKSCINKIFQKSEKPKLLALLTFGILLNLFFLGLYYIPQPANLIGDENYNYLFANCIANGTPVNPNPSWPPLYPYLMGIIFSVLNPHPVYIQILQIVMWLSSAVLFYKIASYLLPFSGASYMALALFLLCPELIAFSHYLWPEIFHLFFFITALWLIICHHKSYLAVVISGLFLGLALLTKLLLLPFMVVVFIFFILLTPEATIHRYLKGLLLILVIFITVLPTMKKNRIIHGQFMIADSSVINLWIGLNDTGLTDYKNDICQDEFYEFQQSGPDIKTRNHIYREKITQKLKKQGFLETIKKQFSKQYYRLFDYETFFTTRLMGGPRHSYHFQNSLLSNLLHIYSHTLYGFILFTSTMGIFFIRVRSFGWPHFFVIFIGYNLFIFLFLHVKTRYVIQFIPMMMFFSSVTLYLLYLLARKKQVPHMSYFVLNKFRITLSIVTAVLMEFVAFRSFLLG